MELSPQQPPAWTPDADPPPPPAQTILPTNYLPPQSNVEDAGSGCDSCACMKEDKTHTRYKWANCAYCFSHWFCWGSLNMPWPARSNSACAKVTLLIVSIIFFPFFLALGLIGMVFGLLADFCNGSCGSLYLSGVSSGLNLQLPIRAVLVLPLVLLVLESSLPPAHGFSISDTTPPPTQQVICEMEKAGDIVVCNNETFQLEIHPIKLWTPRWFIYAGTSVGLVLFAGLISGLTLGLLSMDLLHLEVLEKGGDEDAKSYAKRIIPLAKRHHLLLVTLLLANAAAAEALPIFLDRLTTAYISVILSVTMVLLFSEVIPQSVCSRWGLMIGANMAWFVWILVVLAFPIAWPLSKLLDCILGTSHGTFYRRAELKELVAAHAADHAGQEEKLAEEEASIIKAVLGAQEKTVEQCMTPLEKVDMLEIGTVLDEKSLQMLAKNGHSRVPVYASVRENIIGLLRTKHLICINPADHRPLSSLHLHHVPRVRADTGLYEMLNEFQSRGKSHLVAIEDTATHSVIGILTLEDVLQEILEKEIAELKEREAVLNDSRRMETLRKKASLAQVISMRLSRRDLLPVSPRSAMETPNNKPGVQSGTNSLSRKSALLTSYDVSGAPHKHVQIAPVLSAETAANNHATDAGVAFSAPQTPSLLQRKPSAGNEVVININGDAEKTPLLKKQ